MRRLHDIDRSGWWLLIGLVPHVLAFLTLVNASVEPFLTGSGLDHAERILLVQLISWASVVCDLVLLVFMVTDSDTETNKYGPNPKSA